MLFGFFLSLKKAVPSGRPFQLIETSCYKQFEGQPALSGGGPRPAAGAGGGAAPTYYARSLYSAL
jgi:hypothetical protein